MVTLLKMHIAYEIIYINELYHSYPAHANPLVAQDVHHGKVQSDVCATDWVRVRCFEHVY